VVKATKAVARQAVAQAERGRDGQENNQRGHARPYAEAHGGSAHGQIHANVRAFLFLFLINKGGGIEHTKAPDYRLRRTNIGARDDGSPPVRTVKGLADTKTIEKEQKRPK